MLIYTFKNFIFIFHFLGPHVQHIEAPRLRVELELQLPAYTTAHGNTGGPTHWARPGIKPTSSWIIVGFVSTVSWRELLQFSLTPQNRPQNRLYKSTQHYTGALIVVPSPHWSQDWIVPLFHIFVHLETKILSQYLICISLNGANCMSPFWGACLQFLLILLLGLS